MSSVDTEQRGRAAAWQKLTNDVCTAVSERHVKISRPRSLNKVRRGIHVLDVSTLGASGSRKNASGHLPVHGK